MHKRLLKILICPECKSSLDLIEFTVSGEEITSGVLFCASNHIYPISGGIPRMLPNSINEYWNLIKEDLPTPVPEPVQRLMKSVAFEQNNNNYDIRTKANFSTEWEYHQIGDKTWGMELRDRVRWFFLEPIGIPEAKLKGKRLLDAGCGNGSQSVAYSALGLEVVAIDLSTGLEKGYEFKNRYEGAQPENVHFVQGDLQKPPFAAESFDVIHSAGVLQATPNTRHTFTSIRPLLRSGGTFYTWLIGYEQIVTPLVNSIRFVTTRLSTSSFAVLARLMSHPFVAFCWTVNKFGIRGYGKMTRRESILALHDIFGAPYAHYHSYEEVAGWYKETGFHRMWECNVSRRGFGICGVVSGEVGQRREEVRP